MTQGPAQLPLTGRSEELALARTAVRAAGVVLAGPAGVGKSRLAIELAHEIVGDVGGLLRVIATESAAAIPFGAFSQVLPVDSITASAPVPSCLEAIRREAGDDALVLVDDAHLLDRHSAALVLALATSGAARLIVTVRTPEPVPDAIVSLWKDGLVQRLDLQPLGRGEVRDLIDAVLGPPVQTPVYDRVHTLSQGNPLFVKELLADAVASGALEVHASGWRWEHALLDLSRLRDVIGLRTADLDPAERTALEYVAVGVPLGLGHLVTIVDERVLERLERRGLIAVETGPAGTMVELGHPMYGEVLLSDMPTTASVRIKRELAKAAEPFVAGDNNLLLRVADWHLASGGGDPELFLAAVRVALQRGDPDLGRALAERTGVGNLEAALCMAQIHVAHAEFNEIETVLAPLEAAASRADEATATEYVETRHRGLVRGRGGVKAASVFLDRVTGWHAGDDWAGLVATSRGWEALYEQRAQAAHERVEPWIAGSGLSPRRHFHVLVVAVVAMLELAIAGRADEMEERLREVIRLLEPAPWEARFALHLVDNLRFEAGGNVRELLPKLEADRQRAVAAGDQMLANTLGAYVAVCAVHQGHAETAVRLMEQSLAATEATDPMNTRASLLVGVAIAHCLKGDTDAAEAALARAEDERRHQPASAQRWGVGMVVAKAFLSAARGHTSGAVDELLSFANEAGEFVLSAATALHDALRLGADPRAVALRLGPLADRADSQMLRLMARHAEAAAQSDGAALFDAAAGFEGLGMDLHAAEVATTAAAAFDDEGRGGSARRAREFAATCLARCEGARTPLIGVHAGGPALTAREREVAMMAARGLSNQEIADELTLSVRTVESHVLRASRKFGVRSRHELAAALQWTGESVSGQA